MALYAAEGIVLGARNWGEADKVMTVFTREQGLLRAAAVRPSMRDPITGTADADGVAVTFGPRFCCCLARSRCTATS